MRFPDPNVGYIFGYDSRITCDGILITFLGGIVAIPFKFSDMAEIRREVYAGGRISWDVLRWGKCPHGKEALKILMKRGIFRNHLIVFDDLDTAVIALKSKGAIVNDDTVPSHTR